MEIFIEVTPGNNSVPAIRVRNDLVAISLPVSTTPASSISGLTPQVISGRTSTITTGSNKSFKEFERDYSLSPRPSQGCHRLVLPRDEEKDVCGASDEEKE